MPARRKLTRHYQDVVLQTLRDGRSIATAARKCDVTPKTIRNLRTKNPRFAQKMLDAKAWADGNVQGALHDDALGDPVLDQDGEETGRRKNVNAHACRTWLRNRDPERWPDGADVGPGGSVGAGGVAIRIRLIRGVDDRGQQLGVDDNGGSRTEPADGGTGRPS